MGRFHIEMQIPVPQSRIVKLWVIATGLGLAVGGSVGTITELLFFARPDSATAGDEILIVGLSAAMALSGVLQGIVLRRDPRLAADWALAGTVGLLAGPVIDYLIGSFGGRFARSGGCFKPAAAVLAAGALVGLAQSFVLRRHAHG